MKQFVSGLPGPDLRKSVSFADTVLGPTGASRSHVRQAHTHNELRLDEEEAAEAWYEEKRHREAEWAAFHASRSRRDHLLPEEDLPF